MKRSLFLIAALMLVPGVAAQETNVLQYRGFIVTEQSSDGILPETVVNVPERHTWDPVGGSSMLEVRVSLVVNSGAATNPQADFRVLWNASAVDDCSWHVEGGTVTGGRFNPFVSTYCALPAFVAPGSHTIQVERTSVTGVPVSNAVTSIILHQTETVEMHTNELIEFVTQSAPWLLFAIFVIWAERTRDWSLYALAVLAGIIAIATPGGLFVGWEMLLVPVLFILGLRGWFEFHDTQAENLMEDEI